MTTNREWLYSLDVADLADWFDAEHEPNDALPAKNDVSGDSAGANDADAQQDSREKLEADIRKRTECSWVTAPHEKVIDWLDRQAAITTAYCTSEDESCCEACRAAQNKRVAELTAERDELRDECESYRDNMLAQNKRVAELTAELDACRMRERAAEDYDFREAAQRWALAFEDKCGEVVRLTAERDELQAAIDAMGNGQPVTLFGVDYEKPNKKLLAEHERLLKKLKRLRRRLSKLRKERDYLQKVVKTQAESFKKLECELAGKQ